MKNEKYYLPDISEFCVGFEYEYLLGSDLLKCKIDNNHTIGSDVIIRIPYLGHWQDNNINNIRVKLLDDEDIKNLGWNLYDKNDNRFMFYEIEVDKCKYHLIHLRIVDLYKITKIFNGSDKKEILFSGKIKNKSQLKKIMQQIITI